jgi:hypothetical protein
MKNHDLVLFGLLLAVILPLEVMAAFLAYETLGEIWSGLYFLSMILNAAFLIAAFRSRLIATLGVMALALAIVPYQLYLGYRFIRVQQEAARIVAFAYEHKLAHGEFPADLAGYTYHDIETKPFIQEYRLEDDGDEFMLAYRVGTENTSHTYSPSNGWGYYPD